MADTLPKTSMDPSRRAALVSTCVVGCAGAAGVAIPALQLACRMVVFVVKNPAATCSRAVTRTGTHVSNHCKRLYLHKFIYISCRKVRDKYHK